MPDAHEQAEAVAKWCGWTLDSGYWYKPDGFHVPDLPPYAESLDAMREVEYLLAERGLMGRYIQSLMRVHGWDYMPEVSMWHQLVVSTAAKRLEAAYMTIQEATNA